MKSSSRIAIIGAGISGLTAASILSERGLKVHIFEKSRGPGGRTATRRHENFQFDHGAQYFTVRTDAFRSQVDSWLKSGVVSSWAGKIAFFDGVHRYDKVNDMQRYVGTPGMNAMAKDLAASLSVTYNLRIHSIKYVNDRWQLSTDDNSIVDSFDAIIMTAPPAQTADLIPTILDLKAEIAGVTMLPCWAVMVVFERPIHVDFDGALISNSKLSWVCRNNSKPGRPDAESWILHGSPQWSQDHLEDTADVVMAELISEFNQITSFKSNHIIYQNGHRWRYSICEDYAGNTSIWDGAHKLGVCGDWIAGSKIEGAFLSGRDLAQKIISELT